MTEQPKYRPGLPFGYQHPDAACPYCTRPMHEHEVHAWGADCPKAVR